MKDPSEVYKITKAGWIRILSISTILVGGCLYLLYVNNALNLGLVLAIFFGLLIIAYAFFRSIQIGKKNYKANQAIITETKKSFKGISNYGSLSMLIGALFMSRGDLLEGLLWLFAGLGVIMKKKWGRILFIILAAFLMLLTAIEILNPSSYDTALKLASKAEISSSLVLILFVLFKGLFLFFSLSGIIYFNRTKVKEFFNQRLENRSADFSKSETAEQKDDNSDGIGKIG